MPPAWPEKDDHELLVRVQECSGRAFAVLVERHAERSYRLAYRFLQDRAAAEDVVQDAAPRAEKGLAMKFALFAFLLLIASCVPPQPPRPGLDPYGGTGGTTGSGRASANLSRDAAACEREAILAGPGGKAAAFDSCMRARGHTTGR